MDHRRSICDYLAGEMEPARDPAELGDDFRLIEMGGLDSLAIMQLVAFLEDEFSLVLDNDDLLLENFETIGAIVKLVEARVGDAP